MYIPYIEILRLFAVFWHWILLEMYAYHIENSSLFAVCQHLDTAE
jgi:hypothetical protein